MAIGARSQAARTYLEKFLNDFRVLWSLDQQHQISTLVFNENLKNNLIKRVQECELEELVKHGLRALRDTLPNEVVTYNTAHDTGAGLR